MATDTDEVGEFFLGSFLTIFIAFEVLLIFELLKYPDFGAVVLLLF
jgi:hypothetical protein